MASWRRLRRTRTAFLLALIPGALGVALLHWPLTVSLEKRGGLDKLFLLRGPRTPPSDVCVVAIDDDSYKVIERDPTLAWPRGLHADLIRTLKREGARAVAFDVLFTDPSEEHPDQDAAFESALRETGNVVIGSAVVTTEDPLFRQTQIQEPYEPFGKAAARVAFASFPTDSDGVIRFTYPTREGDPVLALAAYEVATGDTSQRGGDVRLLDYYGPARSIKTVSLYQALDPKQYLPPGFFKDKIVFVGASMDAEPGGLAAKDSFPTPYRRAQGQTTFGVEIHATFAANLLEKRQIKLLDPWLEGALVFLGPLAASIVFTALGPLAGGVAFVALLALPWTVGYLAFSMAGLWVPVVIPSAIQLPLSYGLSLLWYYLTTARDREKIKRAFGLYLSPEMIRRIAEDPDAVNLGGQEIVGTALFTDIKGFTTIAETMSAENTAAMLNAYFSEATKHVFDAGGTLIKFIGDAVFAIWGAPIRREDHATQACAAALALARAQDADGEKAGPVISLATRIGVHTGSMLVGNLGSEQRFDYTAIGDAVNLASRIEGLNKAFGTRALASGETILATDGRFVTRSLGLVRVVGRHEPVVLHELITTQAEKERADTGLLEAFAAARRDLDEGRFDEAALGFKAALDRSGGKDGPSSYFLRAAEELAAAPPPSWDGVLVMEHK
jgi:adenylate cyclase